ncbi:MAG: replication initiation protein [Ruminococcus sp.]|nr:replication initiation protein [Ruminococcus sp.]
MADIYNNAWVQKRNILNELRANKLTLQEVRFFSIYLSKINPMDINTRVVRFSLEDFQKIMDFDTLNLTQLRSATNSLLGKVVNIPKENGRGYTAFQLFKKCDIYQDDFGKWYITIDAHDDALPLMFEFKDKYFKYRLYNALRLKSASHIRMYEILKQYESLGKREIVVSDLQDMLGVHYSRWERFRTKVLDSSQQALRETTDICFDYNRGRVGNGGKWLTIIFTIRKNIPEDKNMILFVDELECTLHNTKALELNKPEPPIKRNTDIETILDLYPQFTVEDIKSIYNRILKLQPDKGRYGTARVDYFKQIYDDVKMLESHGNKIKSYVAYINKILDERIKDGDAE